MIKILKYIKNHSSQNSSLLGNVLIEFKDRVEIWYVIFRSKKGKIFCQPASIKIDNEYKLVFSFKDQEVMRNITAQILKEATDRGYLDENNS